MKSFFYCIGKHTSLTILLSVLLTVSLALSILYLFVLPLTSFTVDDETYIYSWVSCINCPSAFDSTSFSCLETLECNGGNTTLCEKGTDLNISKWVLFSIETIRTLLLLFIFKHLLRQKHKQWCLILLVSQFISAMTGAVLFLSIGKVKLFGCTHSSTCAESGCILLISNIVVSIGILVIGYIKNKNSSELTGFGRFLLDEEILSYLGKILFLLILFWVLLLLSFVFDWIRYNDSFSYKGKMFSMNSYRDYSNIEFSCLSKISDRQNVTDAMERASNASMIGFGIIILGILSLSLWIEHVILQLYHRKSDFCVPLLLSWISFATCSAGLFAWGYLIKVSAFSSCSLSSNQDEITFCFDDGSILALVCCVSLGICAFFYTLIVKHLRSKAMLVIPGFTNETVLKSEAYIFSQEQQANVEHESASKTVKFALEMTNEFESRRQEKELTLSKVDSKIEND